MIFRDEDLWCLESMRYLQGENEDGVDAANDTEDESNIELSFALVQ